MQLSADGKIYEVNEGRKGTRLNKDYGMGAGCAWCLKRSDLGVDTDLYVAKSTEELKIAVAKEAVPF